MYAKDDLCLMKKDIVLIKFGNKIRQLRNDQPLNIKVEYYYILNSWFNSPNNKVVFDYVESVGCKYFIENRLKNLVCSQLSFHLKING